MKMLVRRAAVGSCLLMLAIAVGCSSKSDMTKVAANANESAAENTTDNETSATAEPLAATDKPVAEAAPPADGGAAADESADVPFQLGDMLDPFDPPPLAEVDKTAEWEDRPVLDGIKLMREHQKELGAPPLTVEQALAMKNDSREANAKIADTLGRLAPEDNAGVDEDAELVLLAEGDLKSTNPLLASSITEADYHGLTAFGFFTFDWRLEKFATSDAVVTWQTSKDRMMDKVVMRDDLTWSDGKPLTAHDIEFSFKVLMSKAVIIPAMRTGTDQIKYVKAYDDRTLVYFHKEPLATNEANMNFYVLPKHIYESTLADDPTMTRSQVHSKFEDSPVVGGPYTLSRRQRGQEFVLERRESSYMHNGKQVREKPYFKTVRFKVIEDRNTALLAVKAGNIDSLMLLADQWYGQTNDDAFYQRNTKVSGEEWTAFHFIWNLETPFFSDQRVREAMSYAFDYEEMLTTIYYGLYDQGVGNFHPSSPMFPKDNPPQPYKQDLDKAEELLEAAGWIDSDGDGIRDKEIKGRRVKFEFTLLCAQFEDRIQVCTLMKECLDSIGIVCNIKPTEFTVLTQMMTDGNFQAELGGWGAGADPDTSKNIFGTGENRNYGRYSNPRVDELFEQGRREFDPDKRNAIYGEIHKTLWEDQPYTWLFYRNSFYAFNKKLRGYNFSPRGPFHFAPGISSMYAVEAK